MISIDQFIDYKKVCPLCNNENLNFHFISNNSKKIRYINNDIEVKLDINGFPTPRSKRKFTAFYYIDKSYNTFYVDFSDYTGSNLKYISLNKINDCKNFTKKAASNLYKICNVCTKYSYVSSTLEFNYSTCKVEPFQMQFETMLLPTEPIDNVVQLYLLNNNYVTNKSTIMSGKDQYNTRNFYKNPSENFLETTLIKINDYSKLLNQIETLVCFS